MSDGNYHRSHLPQNNYQSGVRAGKAAARAHALASFAWLLDTCFPALSADERKRLNDLFHAKLTETDPLRPTPPARYDE